MRFWTGVCCSTLLLAQGAAADMGAKPTMSFYFAPRKPAIQATGGQLWRCKTAEGDGMEPFRQMGPQRFRCGPDGCFAMAYGFAKYHRLEIQFSDGRTRKSNVFPRAGFHSIYRVTVGDHDLRVEADPKAAPPSKNRY